MSEPVPASEPSIFGRFFSHVFAMPGWQKVVLSAFTAIGATGLAGEAYHKLVPADTTQVAVVAQPGTPAATPDHSQGFVSPSNAAPVDPNAPIDDSTDQSMFRKLSPGMMRMGLGFIAAFIIGWLFRLFIKTMALITLLGGGLLLGLSYFHVINVDLSEARTKYADSISWLSDQAAKVRDTAMEHLPASTSTTLGLFVGFRKK